jgi:type IV pilus assembly protein PilA
MLTPLKYRDAEKEEGFTLIELLVVVIIIGILAAIAIPVFLNQRQRGWTAAAQSELRNAAVAQESHYTGQGTGNTYATSQADLEAQGFRTAADVTFAVIGANASGYCMSAVHTSAASAGMPTWYFSSQDGAPSTTACTAPTP